MRALAQRAPASAALVDFASARRDLRATSLRIFDRSFAVTYWLQAVAIGIGLFGIAASFSAQVLARRKEFGLLAHLGPDAARRSSPWSPAKARRGRRSGALARPRLLGLAVSVVLVHVVNPQSFHWTMDLLLPWLRLLRAVRRGACSPARVTAWLAGRARRGPRRGAGGEGGLVMAAARSRAARCSPRWRRPRWPAPHAPIGAARRRASQFPRDSRRASRVRAPSGGTSPGQARSGEREFGFQVTFFRSRVDVDAGHAESRFAAKQLVFAHAARHRRRGPQAAPRPAHRARRLRHRRGGRGRHRRAPARLVAARGSPTAYRRAHRRGRRLRASTCDARRPSRCCCRAAPACRARARGPSRRATTTASRSSR